MKTINELDAFLEQQLQPTLHEMEQQRVAARNWARGIWIVCLIPFAILMFLVVRFYKQPPVGVPIGPGRQFLLIGGMVMAFALGGYCISYFMMKRRSAAGGSQQDFKNRIVKPLIGFINPDFHYQPSSHASYEEFMESGLFAPKDYRVSGNDQVYGKNGDMHFQCCDLSVAHLPLATVRGEVADTIFCGSYFIGQFPRYFSTPVYILSRSNSWFSSSAADNSYIQTWNLGQKVLPSDPAFNKMFVAYSPDTSEATQLLTSLLMEQLVHLQERMKASLFISFRNNRVYAGIGHGKDYFETTLHQSLNNRQMLRDFYLDFLSLLQISEGLKGNHSIWTAQDL
ncbi:DUF3137 domain-containing protein [Chitinophaga sp. 30R24]|uniref:DUF3137 domain-containing protein n=1 Tax=Chitinophaga sp. 30R24 TaxID=3248838 RepID=UPI003B90A1B3